VYYNSVPRDKEQSLMHENSVVSLVVVLYIEFLSNPQPFPYAFHTALAYPYLSSEHGNRKKHSLIESEQKYFFGDPFRSLSI
jgi:hypothetical protein